MADADDDIVSCVTWDRRNPDRSVDSAVAVMMQPPWIVSAADLDSFVNCTRVRTKRSESNSMANRYLVVSSKRKHHRRRNGERIPE